MSHGVPVTIDGATKQVDGRDVADAEGPLGPFDPDDPLWRQAAERYVDEHPRLQQVRFSERQRLAILRRVAAGPANTADLLSAMRSCGWVGATDLENRLRELGGQGQRTGGANPVPLVSEGAIHRLAAPFPDLSDLQRTALGYIKTLAARQASPLTGQAMQTLDGMLPGVGAHSGQADAPTMRLTTTDMERFEAARVKRLPVEVSYHSMNSGREKRYRLVPVEYVPAGPAMKVICVDVDADGHPTGGERQFALERIRSVTALDLPAIEPDDLVLHRETLHLVVLTDLYRIMADRNQFHIRDFEAVELDGGAHHEVRGTFPVALGWDVMEQMCAWAGSVVVYEPLWLVNAVMRRLLAGVSAMQDGVLRLEKPRPGDHFGGLEEAAFPVEPEDDGQTVGPRKLAPPHG